MLIERPLDVPFGTPSPEALQLLLLSFVGYTCCLRPCSILGSDRNASALRT